MYDDFIEESDDGERNLEAALERIIDLDYDERRHHQEEAALRQNPPVEDPQEEEDMHLLFLALNPKHSYGLSFEILHYAFQRLKAHPEKTIAECIQHGFDEWVK